MKSKQKIQKAHKTQVTRLKVSKSDTVVPASVRLGQKMTGFIENGLCLAGMPRQGVVRAIVLSIYQVKSSCSRSDDLGPLCGWSAEEYQIEGVMDLTLDELPLDLVKQAREENLAISLKS